MDMYLPSSLASLLCAACFSGLVILGRRNGLTEKAWEVCCTRTRQDVYSVFHIPWLSPTSSIALGQADDDQFSQLMVVAFLAMCLTAIKRKKIPAIMYSLGYDYHSSG